MSEAEFTIWKYKLGEVGIEEEIEMPLNASVLSAAVQQGDMCIWAVHATGVEKMDRELRKFIILGTGHPTIISDQVTYGHIASVQQSPFVWHVFEVMSK